jgi:hypothetical protein
MRKLSNFKDFGKFKGKMPKRARHLKKVCHQVNPRRGFG